ncbi:hypothetical protein TSAR_015169 [Trichomalopsis sarcophagae]|uniref:Uncharacterized protein n=1 Tax=Trichomalopsis sarcophagae TaxID=543379 RepID=A0A232FE30_9HYME|nr:hypothetical protein TSAR_015169 [Trichomalopsis sarcophagae]
MYSKTIQSFKESFFKELFDLGIIVSVAQGHLNYCDGFNHDVIICKLLNADLKVTATTELPKRNIPIGIMLNSQVINLPNHRGQTYLQRVDADSEKDFCHVTCDST